jgi:hypothetical protein
MTVVYALLTAFSNALNLATQHKASIASPHGAKAWHLVVYLFRNPLWLFGWVALGAAFVFQALALRSGQMSVVQPLLVMELVFVLVLRRVWIHQTIRTVTWWSAGITCVTLALFLFVSEPQGGEAMPSSHIWTGVGVTTIGVASLLSLLGTRGSPARRAALMGSATAILWALVATVLKTTMGTLSQFGVAGVFVHWPVYALAVTGLAAELLNQVTLHVGPLSVSQPFLVIVDPIVSIALSVWVFEEYFTPNAIRLTLGAISFAIMCVAVTVLTRTAPATMERVDAAPRNL